MGDRVSDRGSDWGVDALDLPAYLDRVGVPARAPSAQALAELTAAHITAIPFEAVDVVLGAHPGISLDVVAAKLVDRRRGGYCFEHATLFAAALTRLGYTVRRRLARVQPHHGGPRTHMITTVTVDGVDHLADVGFGTGMWRPVPLVHGTVTDQAGWPHLLTGSPRGWTLSRREAGEWEPQYAWEDVDQRPVDFEVAHHYTATHPRSPFVGRLVVMRLAEGSLRRLIGDVHLLEHPDGTVETTPVTDLPATLAALDVHLTDDELTLLLART